MLVKIGSGDGRGQVGRLRQRRHLVTEIRPGDHRAGSDGHVQAETPGDGHECDADGAHHGPRTAHRHGDDRTQNRRDGIEDHGIQEPNPPVGQRRDGAGHVPGADQRAHREEDEDGAHGRTDAVDRGLGQIGDRVAVEVAHLGGQGSRQQQRHLDRASDRVLPVQLDGQGQSDDEKGQRDQGLPEHGRPRNPVRVRGILVRHPRSTSSHRGRLERVTARHPDLKALPVAKRCGRRICAAIDANPRDTDVRVIAEIAAAQRSGAPSPPQFRRSALHADQTVACSESRRFTGSRSNFAVMVPITDERS